MNTTAEEVAKRHATFLTQRHCPHQEAGGHYNRPAGTCTVCCVDRLIRAIEEAQGAGAVVVRMHAGEKLGAGQPVVADRPAPLPGKRYRSPEARAAWIANIRAAAARRKRERNR